MRKKKYNQQSYHNVSELEKLFCFFFLFLSVILYLNVASTKFQNHIARTDFLISSFVHYVTLGMLFNSSKFFLFYHQLKFHRVWHIMDSIQCPECTQLLLLFLDPLCLPLNIIITFRTHSFFFLVEP